MDEFKKKLTAQQILLLSGLLGVCSAALLTRFYEKATSATENIQAFIEGVQVGVVIGLLGFLLFFFVRNILAIRNPERLKKLYISEMDERKQFIQRQAGSVGMNIVMYGLTAGTVVAGNINNTVFFTLLGACVFVALVRGFLKIYYRKKY